MHTIIKLNLNDEDHFFHFNNYAQVELMKWTDKKDDITEATVSLNSIIEQNFLLGMSVIVYCGLIGYQYSKFNLKHGYSLERISELVGNVAMNEWAPIWEAYKDATGMSQFIQEQAALNAKKEETKKAEAEAKGEVYKKPEKKSTRLKTK